MGVDNDKEDVVVGTIDNDFKDGGDDIKETWLSEGIFDLNSGESISSAMDEMDVC